MKVNLHVTSQTSNHYHRNRRISQYQLIYTLSFLDTSTKSHQILQIRQSELYLLPTITLLHQFISISASQCNITDINKAKYGADWLNKYNTDRIYDTMLLQSMWHLDFSSCSVTLPIIPKQGGKRIKKCKMLYAQFTYGSTSFVDSLVLQLIHLFSWIVLALLNYIEHQRTWLTIQGPTHL